MTRLKFFLPFMASYALADGLAVDKVYSPYVTALEKEIEYRALYLSDSRDELDNASLHRLGIGTALNDQWFVEAYLLGFNGPGNGFEIDGYEVEARLQLTEQGEYDLDIGALFELEKERNDDIWEYAVTGIATKEFAHWVHTFNVSLIYEWGDHIDNEFETAYTMQSRYRYSPTLEPAIEFYSGQDSYGLGPVLTGRIKNNGPQSFLWEAGLIFGLSGDSVDTTARLMLEYEFY